MPEERNKEPFRFSISQCELITSGRVKGDLVLTDSWQLATTFPFPVSRILRSGRRREKVEKEVRKGECNDGS
jgi:hypothetical protein